MNQVIRWVSVPAGPVGPDRLRLSVFVAPQLEADEDTTLADFPAVADWPATLAGLRWQVELDTGPVIVATATTAADPVLWAALLPPTTPVQSFEPDDPTGDVVQTFSAPVVETTLQSAYAGAMELTAEPEPDLPAATLVARPGLAELFAPMMDVFRTNAFLAEPDAAGFQGRLHTLLSDSLSAGRARRAVTRPELIELMPSGGSATEELTRGLLFHRKPDLEAFPIEADGGPPDLAAPAPVPASPVPTSPDELVADLHRILATLADHPTVLRALGLVVDLELPRDAPGLDTAAALRVRPLHGGELTDSRPWTAYVLGPDTFAARPRQPGDAPGLLPLPADRFSVSSLDTDGGVLKALALAAELVAAETTGSTPSGRVPPALRSTGLQLVRAGAAADLHAGFVQARELRAADEPVLVAEDLVRGYRLDVRDLTRGGDWLSLHRRRTAYSAPGWQATVEDEGFVTDNVVRPAGATPAPVAYVHEGMVTWEGWSLSVPRPGKTIDLTTTTPDGTPAPPVRPVPDPPAGLPLTVDAGLVPGTLPRLRFGRSYQLRVRTVDVTGNGPTLAEADALLAGGEDGYVTAAVPFLRFEPVAPPVLVGPAEEADADGPVRLVVRTGDGGVSPPADRRLLPPKAALELVERHGRLDPALDTPQARREVYQLATRESGTLAGVTGDGLPWLPDPQASGVAMIGLPGTTGPAPVTVPYAGPAWHQPRRVVLRLQGTAEDSAPGPVWDDRAGTFTVALPVASRAEVQVASRIGDPDVMALLEWTRAGLPAEGFDRVRAVVADSRHEMVTPWQPVELVHAVQRPVVTPEFVSRPVVDRVPGGVEVSFHAGVRLHPDSMHGLELFAGWTEPLDDGVTAPGEQSYRQVVKEFDVATVAQRGDSEPADEPRVLIWDIGTPDDVHAFPDARHRLVRYELEATSAFADFFPPEFAEPLPQDQALGTNRLTCRSAPIDVHVPSSVRPPAPRLLDVVPLVGRSVDGPAVVRDGGWLRITLGRPWFVTGSGELLGVLAATVQPGESDPMHAYVSLAGADPIRRSAPDPGLTPDRLGGDESPALLQLRLPELIEQLGTPAVPPVVAALYRPQFDADRDCWYVDVRVDPGDGYFPFVRLRLVRVQEHAIEPDGSSPDAFRVSPSVTTDVVQLLPTRRLEVRRDGGAVRVDLHGPTYAAVRRVDHRPDGQGLAVVTAVVQRRDQAYADDLLAWSDAAEPVRLERRPDGAGWSATVPVPGGPGPLRLLVREEDRVPADLTMATAGGLASRTVYLEAVPL